jgi:hypothetical protein
MEYGVIMKNRINSRRFGTVVIIIFIILAVCVFLEYHAQVFYCIKNIVGTDNDVKAIRAVVKDSDMHSMLCVRDLNKAKIIINSNKSEAKVVFPSDTNSKTSNNVSEMTREATIFVLNKTEDGEWKVDYSYREFTSEYFEAIPGFPVLEQGQSPSYNREYPATMPTGGQDP